MEMKKVLTLDDLIDPTETLPAAEMPEPSTPTDLKPIKRVYSHIGWSLCAIVGVVLIVQSLVTAVVAAIWPDGCWLTESSTGMWLLTFVPQYLVAMPVGILMMRKLPAEAPAPVNMGRKNFWIFLSICFFLTYTGSFLGNFLSGSLSGGSADNALDAYTLDTNPIKVLFLVVLAPLFEELVFRKYLIDRTRIHGEKMAVFLSALTFGLFHMNLYQFFYAFMLGWLFAYIYIRTGKLRYPVIMHGIVNFFGGVIAPMVLSLLDMETLDAMVSQSGQLSDLVQKQALFGLFVYYAYLFVLLAVWVIGLVFFIKRSQRLVWKEVPQPLPANKQINTIYVNGGMIVFLVFFTLMTLASIAV